MKPAAALAIVLGVEITHDPLLGPGRALIRASVLIADGWRQSAHWEKDEACSVEEAGAGLGPVYASTRSGPTCRSTGSQSGVRVRAYQQTTSTGSAPQRTKVHGIPKQADTRTDTE